MTDAGMNWMLDKVEAEDKSKWDFTHALSRKAAEFWVRAFCDEVEKRAITKNVGRPDTQLAVAFVELKCDLLRGDQHRTDTPAVKEAIKLLKENE